MVRRGTFVSVTLAYPPPTHDRKRSDPATRYHVISSFLPPKAEGEEFVAPSFIFHKVARGLLINQVSPAYIGRCEVKTSTTKVVKSLLD